MGTNYYMQVKPPCESCNRPYQDLHIGKSSAGWCFGLHIYPEQNINELQDWINLWRDPAVKIRDEYNREINKFEMLWIIVARKELGRLLERDTIDGHSCVGHGQGTYDLMTGDFS